jgi:hypothetical protein
VGDTDGRLLEMRRARLAAVSFAVVSATALFVAVAGGCSSDDAAPAPETADGGEVEASPTHPMEAAVARPLGPAVECTIGAAVESESNDTPATANAFTELGFCGVLDTGTDVDYFTFATPTGKKLTVFQGVITGSVDFELTLNGATFGPSETGKFGSGTYVGKAFTKAGKPAAYRIRVQYD